MRPKKPDRSSFFLTHTTDRTSGGNQTTIERITSAISRWRPPMKSVIAPALATLSFSMILVCGVFAASALMPRYETHKFENLDASIWTSKPTRVDQTAQTFERLPPEIKIADTGEQRFDFRDPLDTQSQSASQSPKAQRDEPRVSLETSAMSVWCHSRYRSYRDSDNSYQPFSGGPRAQCKRPSGTVAMNTIADAGGTREAFQ